MTYKIMIVDDEPANLRTLVRLFRQNYEVVTAESGPEALTLLQQHDVALLISDQRMPDMSGIDLMKKTVDVRPQMVRILLTGYTDVEALIESINCGLVYRYITKPWNNDDLCLTVSRGLEHYEVIKSRHLLDMENKRLRSRLSEISELAAETVRSFNPAADNGRGDFVSRVPPNVPAFCFKESRKSRLRIRTQDVEHDSPFTALFLPNSDVTAALERDSAAVQLERSVGVTKIARRRDISHRWLPL